MIFMNHPLFSHQFEKSRKVIFAAGLVLLEAVAEMEMILFFID
jgi:hypothetical protein